MLFFGFGLFAVRESRALEQFSTITALCCLDDNCERNYPKPLRDGEFITSRIFCSRPKIESDFERELHKKENWFSEKKLDLNCNLEKITKVYSFEIEKYCFSLIMKLDFLNEKS